MNRKMIFYMLGQMLLILAVLLLVPAAVAAVYVEKAGLAFLAAAAAAFLPGILLRRLMKPADRTVYAKEGFVIVAFSWMLLSVVGALPFVFCGEIPSFVDALFETASGFSTTGASILTDVESLSRSVLFWRSFTHWVGGMGVIVFVMALFPSESGRTMHIMRAEMPGPIVGKIVPKVRETAKQLYFIYIALTLIEFIFLLCGGMPVFDSLLHSFGTAGTGGFGIKNNSIAGYSPYLKWVITVFMYLFGVNFNLYFLTLTGKAKTALKSFELFVYTAIVVVSAAVITVNILPQYESAGTAVRDAAFQVSSIVTTTGFSTADFDLWPQLSKTVLVLLMFIGGCAGSTAGGLKVSRIILMFRMIKRDLRKMIHPRSVGVVKFDGKAVDDGTLEGIGVYFGLYFIIFAAITLFISFEPFCDFETAFTATSACINNIGPGLAAVGPASNFAAFSVPSKLVLTFAMLLGRLEIFPILLALSPKTWLRK